LFDGHACVHKFKINNGRVTYANKFLQTESFKYSNENKTYYFVSIQINLPNKHYLLKSVISSLSSGFGDIDPCLNFLGRFQVVFSKKFTIDNTNVNVVPYGDGQLYALTESNIMSKLDPETLDVVKTIDIIDYLPYTTSTIAHPHIEQNGCIYWFYYILILVLFWNSTFKKKTNFKHGSPWVEKYYF